MTNIVCRSRNQTTASSRLLPAIDQLLVAGIQLGPSKKHEAINKILQLVPEWKRGDCWRRIRQLRKTSGLAGVEGRPSLCPPENCSATRRLASRPWLPEDDAKLMELAGYEPVRKIAQILDRSAAAVRFRLGALGISARVTDGWSQSALRKLLRMSRGRMQFLVGNRLLRVRDPRITRSSLRAWCEKNRSVTDLVDAHERTLAADREEAYSWKSTAKLLDISEGEVQNLIFAGHLRLMDPFVSERSFGNFCRKHGAEINLALLDADTKKWLLAEYGVSEAADGKVVPRAQKHVLVTRACHCGRKIAGNVYFRHVRLCRSANSSRSER